MGKGIQIKKPDAAVAEVSSVQASKQKDTLVLSPLYYLMLVLTFPAALVAGYFFLQTRPV